MTPLVSILIPAFRAAALIGQTLDSALAQTHQKIEVIVVDDGSDDDTFPVAQNFSARHPDKIRVVRQSNAGASSARNHALRLARGDFIQFLDADDLLSPQKIQAQITLLATRPGGTLATCRWGRFECDPSKTRFVDHDVFRDFTPLDWLLLHVSAARMMHPAAWLVPRTVAANAGPWDERLSLNDDGEYFSRVVLASAGIAFASDPDASTHYRSGIDASLSSQKSPRALKSLHLAGERLSSRLLGAEDSIRTREALARHWQYLAYELYPGAPGLSRDAEARARALGGSYLPPPLGRRAQIFARLFGWRLARRLSLRRRS